jgi:hypothetical protein
MRPDPCRTGAGLVGLSCVVLLAACGGTDGGSTADAPATGASVSTSPADGSAAAGDDEFCTRAAGLDERVDTALSESADDASLPGAFRQLAEELRAIAAPDAIADDWTTMHTGLDRMADALSDADLTDPDSLEALDAAEGDLDGASDRVQTYLREECGIDG